MSRGGRTDYIFSPNTNNQNKSLQKSSNISIMNTSIHSTNSNTSSNDISAIGEKKRLKVQLIQNNPNAQPNNTNLQINPKTWPNLKAGNLLEITLQSNLLGNNPAASIGPNSNTNSAQIQANSSLNRSAAATNNISNAQLHQSQSSNNFSIDDETSPFLLQVTQSSFVDSVPPDVIRIDQAASMAPFSIKALSYVNVTVVDKSSVVLDLVELLFKEQYFNGNDMLRIKVYLENSCVYMKKSIEFCGMRCTVREMWARNADVVTCGYISDRTRLVFRSQSAMCTIYIQMSREMWEFDVNGEMYHEKAINFLGELFANWKNQTCQHDVTIALFSRIFYKAESLEEFPSSISLDIKKDHKGRFYEDFFRVVYQNERYEDWTPTLVILKRLIKEYRDYILNYHRRTSDNNVPESYLSSAAEGNFLETLNLSSSVFERHFIDRPFDRTGMMSLVITPGNGIYEVSRELTKITKERVIDNGIGSDLVCLGEQPLHAVPLFKYETADSFDVPHWINLSFYKSSETVRYCNSNFMPCSKIKIKKTSEKAPLIPEKVLPGYKPDKENYQKLLEETDNIFENSVNKNTQQEFFGTSKRAPSKQLASSNFQNSASRAEYKTTSSSKPTRSANNSVNLSSSYASSEINNYMNNNNNSNSLTSTNTTNSNKKLTIVGNDQDSGISAIENTSKFCSNKSNDDYNDDDDDNSSIEIESDSEQSLTIKSEENSMQIVEYKRAKSKINPFMPESIKPRMSFERRRWAHAFPLRSDGTPIFPNWTTVNKNNEPDNSIQNAFYSNGESILNDNSNRSSNLAINQTNSNTNINQEAHLNEANHGFSNMYSNPRISPDSTSLYISQQNKNKDRSFKNNQNGLSTVYSSSNLQNQKQTSASKTPKEIIDNLVKDESIAMMKTGVAWKSLTIPACLPLTTDSYPNKKTWFKNFACSSNYTLLLDDIREQYGYNNYQYNSKISMAQVFNELVGHRLAMGFQMVVDKKTFITINESNTNAPTKDQIISTTPTSSSSGLAGNMSSINLEILKQFNDGFFRTQISSIKGYYKLCLGRIYHDLYYLVDPTNKTDYIRIEIYIPKEKKEKPFSKSIEYKYRFQVPDSKTYDISYCEMSRKSLESIKWNLIDSYICIQGNGSLTPSDLQKCWRQRLYLIPLMYAQNSKLANNSEQLSTTPILSTSASSSSINSYTSNMITFQNLTPAQIPASMLQNPSSPTRCDIYQRKSIEELKFFRDYYFIKFIEGLNKLSRADDKRSYSKGAIAYVEMMNSSSNGADFCLAISAIMNNLYQNSNNVVSSNLNTSRIQSTTIPNLNIKQSQQTFEKLASPKKILLPLLAKYYSISDSEAKSPLITNAISSDSPLSPTWALQKDAIKAEIYNYLNNEYKNQMLHTVHGVPFIQNKNDIPLNCFISSEAIWWCIEHIHDVENEADAILLMQIMTDFDLIRHISVQQKLFIHGFYLYYIITDENRNHNLYTKDYLEVGFCDIDCTRKSIGGASPKEKCASIPIVSVKDLLPQSSDKLPVSSGEMFRCYLDLFSKYTKLDAFTIPDGCMKLVNVDVDPNHKSNRVEWASAVYRSHYHQLCAFELEIMWEMATGSLLSELVMGWAKLSNRFNYHIVAAPIDPFAVPIVANSDPLRGSIYIKLNINCLMQDELVLFESVIDEKYKINIDSIRFNEFSDFSVYKQAETVYDYIIKTCPEYLNFLDKKYMSKDVLFRRFEEEVDFFIKEWYDFIESERIARLQYFQEAILEKFGFVRNATIVKNVGSDEDPVLFIHSSGGMFVCIPNYYNSFSIRSRHTSANNNSKNNKAIALNNRQSVTDASKKDRSLETINENNDSNSTAGKKLDKSNKKFNPNKRDFDSSLAPMSTIDGTKPHDSTGDNDFSSAHTNMNSISTNRERSNSKSQHLEFLKLNEKNYLSNSTIADDLDDLSVNYENISASEPSKNSSVCSLDDSIQSNKNESRIENKDITLSKKIKKAGNESNKDNTDSNVQAKFVSLDSINEENYEYRSKRKPFYYESETFLGFLWSWNFMLGKKWRSLYTGDETFQDNILSDFRLFCSNKDGRLQKFFNESKSLLK